MNSFNFTGNLGSDCRTGNAGGTAVVNFSVAVKSGWGDKEQTIWIDVALWGKQAESGLVGYLTKGQQVAVTGELSTREHEGKTYLTVRANSVDLVGGKSDSAPSPSQPVQQSNPAPASTPKADDFDDDIPFFDHLGRLMWNVV